MKNNELKIVLTLVTLLFSFFAFSQKVKKIEILHADSLVFDEAYGRDFKRLIGNVSFKHENAIMYCDSAFFYSELNSLDAFSKVHIVQGDTLHLYGDFLRYDGNTKLAKVRRNVTLINNDATLTTDSLNYDRISDVGYYFNYGKIVDSSNTLTSLHGYYYSKTRDFFSIDSVKLVNPEYIMYSDTLRYNTRSEISYFFGPTDIISDSNSIYCENGWYDTRKDISQYNENAYFKNSKQTLKGDSLYYDRNKGMGKAFENVELIDTTRNIILTGEYALYFERPERAMLTDNALFIQVADSDSLYLHADTIRSYYDTVGNYRIIKAYYKVKIFKNNLQGKCDSLLYSLKDSTIQLYRNPVIWSEKNQLTADFIELFTKNQSVEHIELTNSAFIISPEDSTDTIRFNQIKGKKMIGYFKDDKLVKIDVDGNGQTLYFPKDKEELIGMNKTECSKIIIFVKDNDFDKIYFIEKPVAKLLPMENVTGADLHLPDFRWLEKIRPKNKEEIFIWTEN